MTPAARLQAVIEILDAGTAQPLERQLKAWFRAHRFAGSKDRRAIAERIYAIFRNRAHFAHRMGSDAPRALIIAALLADGEDPEALFTGGYGPQPLSAAERAAILSAPAPPPAWVEGEYPAWLEGELIRSLGAELKKEMAAFQDRAPLDLRANRLKAKRDDVLATLNRDGFSCQILDGLPDGLRCQTGTALSDHPLYAAGAFEI